MHLSQSEENYIKAIFHIVGDTQLEASTNAIAEFLNTSAASVTDMVRKLSKKNLVHYEKYKGVTLSKEGNELAIKVIRKHRLWEVFLVDKLKFNWDEVHEVAEELEHIQSPLLIKRLDEFLQFPKFDPHGDPIPDENGRLTNQDKMLLKDYPELKNAGVVGVKDCDSSFLRYLDKVKIGIGSQIKIIEIIEFDKSMEISIDNKNTIIISHEIASNIYVV